jgi:hypothetical protein
MNDFKIQQLHNMLDSEKDYICTERKNDGITIYFSSQYTSNMFADILANISPVDKIDIVACRRRK